MCIRDSHWRVGESGVGVQRLVHSLLWKHVFPSHPLCTPTLQLTTIKYLQSNCSVAVGSAGVLSNLDWLMLELLLLIEIQYFIFKKMDCSPWYDKSRVWFGMVTFFLVIQHCVYHSINNRTDSQEVSCWSSCANSLCSWYHNYPFCQDVCR